MGRKLRALAARAKRGGRTGLSGKVPRTRLLAGLFAALVLGAALGVILGTRAPPRHPESVAPRAAAPAKPPSIAALPAPPKAAAPIAEGRLAGPLPLVSEPRMAARVTHGSAAAPPAAASAPKLITAQKDPSVVYEEAVEEPPAHHAGPASPSAAGAQHPPASEHKPILLGALEHLAIKPTVGPQPAWLQSALAMPDLHGRPMVALVIDDSGVDRRRTERAMHLPPRVTMSFLPYAPEVAKQVEEARGLGHEIIVHVPMEPLNGQIDAGPNVLRLQDASEEILRRLDWDLSRFTGYVGVNNHMGSRFTQDGHGMRTVLEALKTRGLLFLDSRTTPGSVGAKLARELGLPTLERDVFLDNVDSREEVAARLAEVARIARHDGYAIAIGHPRDATLDELETWVAEAAGEGLVLVPLSAVMRALIAVEPEQARVQQLRG
ncbi:MAG: divergent polysaccharide deacetylase family protein [Alphaproteobacteria bacterium]